MDNRDAVRLIAGSAAINRMRTEISLLVGMLLGLVNKEMIAVWRGDSLQLYATEFIFEDEQHQWILIYATHTKWELAVECRLLKRHSGGGTSEARAYCSSDDRPLPLKYVVEVHRLLGGFVEGMINTFPELKDQLQPFLDAAGQ